MKRLRLLLLALCLFAQTTHVVELEKSDAEMIRSRYQAMKQAEEAFQQADKWVKHKYAGEVKSENEAEGMEYSADFRFLLKPVVGRKDTEIQYGGGLRGIPDFKFVEGSSKVPMDTTGTIGVHQ